MDEDIIPIPQTFWIRIIVQRNYNDEYLHFLYWELPNFQLRIKYSWYFKYRAALFQVQYPKYIVEMTWGHYQSLSKEETEKIKLRNKIIGKKRTLTKWKNILKEVKDNWNRLWPIEEDALYIKAKNKVESLEKEINSLNKSIS